MNAAVLVDTNILLYGIDVNDSTKQKRAQEVIRLLLATGRLTLTAQVLNEFYWRSTRARRGLPPMLSPDRAAAAIRHWDAATAVLPVPSQATILALDAIGRYSMQWWDAVLWATARLNAVATIYTEDFTHDREVEGVRFVNPFLSPTP